MTYRPDPGKREPGGSDVLFTVRESHFVGLALFVAGFLLALFLSAVVFFYETPAINCYQEDSCYADYYHHQWHIIYGQRPEQQILTPSSTSKE